MTKGKINLIQLDIRTAEVDAIILAANEYLLVCSTIRLVKERELLNKYRKL